MNLLRHPVTLLAGLATAAGAALAEPVAYAIDPTHTFVYFESRHMGTSTLRGRFDRKEGTVVLDRAARTGRTEMTIDMSSVDTGVAALDTHLKGADFFDVAKYPTATFVADRFTFDGDKVASVSGALTLRGKTLPISLKATNFNCYLNPMLKREVCGGDFETSLVRSAFGIDYALPMGFPDSIPLHIQIEAARQ